MLAAALIRNQGIDVLALFFETPFFTSKRARKSARSMDLPFKAVNITSRHLEVVKHPKHGYGGNMNPCIDCHALMFRIAGEMCEQEGAHFVITGEVLGQRPMSQNKRSLSLIDAESGLNRLLLRPLSAKCLPVTTPEDRGWVNRELLMGFQGRSRKPQMDLAMRLNITEYPSPAGGCLLTEKGFSQRLHDLLSSRSNLELRELELLKLGRHFRIAPETKLVVGRNRRENQAIQALSTHEDIILTTTAVPGPTALVLGDISGRCLELASAITVAYSDAHDNQVTPVSVAGKDGEKTVMSRGRDKKEFRHYMI